MKKILWMTAGVLAGCYAQRGRQRGMGAANDRACLLHAVEVDEEGNQKPGSICKKVREPKGAQTKLVTDACDPKDLPTCEDCLRRLTKSGYIRFGAHITPKFHSCQVERRKLIKRGTLNLKTGEQTFTSEGWEVEPCDSPLFDDAGQKTGVCRSCARGWKAEENYPTEKGEEQIAAAKETR